MGKMHELLAVESDREAVFKKVVTEAGDTFRKRSDHFLGHHKTLEMKEEGKEMAEAAAEDHKAMVTTVGKKLDYVSNPVVTYLDAVLQKECTNQVAKADLVLPDGTVLGKDLPATFLLGLESKLKFLRQMYENIPTLSPGTEWVADDQMGEGVYKSKHLETKAKTETTVEHKVIVEATEHHPAQIGEASITEVVGVFKTKHWSGMISPARKSELLGRLDVLMQAAKQARMRANSADTIDRKIGKELVDYINA